jgi:hypothetical protein
MELSDPAQLRKARTAIIVASVAIPLVVAVLFGVKIDGIDLHFLPTVYAGINALTALLLIAALVAIKQKKKALQVIIFAPSYLSLRAAKRRGNPLISVEDCFPQVATTFLLISYPNSQAVWAAPSLVRVSSPAMSRRMDIAAF